MKNVIEELYYSDVFHIFRTDPMDDEYHRLMKDIIKAEEELINTYSGALALFTKYQDASSAIDSLCRRHDFVSGFRLGAQFALEMLKPVK